jgi:hypothetical protein
VCVCVCKVCLVNFCIICNKPSLILSVSSTIQFFYPTVIYGWFTNTLDLNNPKENKLGAIKFDDHAGQAVPPTLAVKCPCRIFCLAMCTLTILFELCIAYHLSKFFTAHYLRSFPTYSYRSEYSVTVSQFCYYSRHKYCTPNDYSNAI